MKKLQKWCRVLYTYFIGYSCASMPKRTGISILIKTKNTLSSPYGRGAAVFEAVPKTTDAVRGQTIGANKKLHLKQFV